MSSAPPLLWRRCSLTLAWACIALGPSAARAQVFEVGDGGTLHEVGVHDLAPPPKRSWAPHPLPSPAGPLAAAAAQAADRHAVSLALVDTVARRESAYHIHAVSRVGALGVMQLMPATARALGVDPRDPAANIEGGAAYLSQQMARFGGRVDLALAAYNAGPGAVKRYGGVPPYRETRAYVAAALDRLADLSLALPHPDYRSLP